MYQYHATPFPNPPSQTQPESARAHGLLASREYSSPIVGVRASACRLALFTGTHWAITGNKRYFTHAPRNHHNGTARAPAGRRFELRSWGINGADCVPAAKLLPRFAEATMIRRPRRHCLPPTNSAGSDPTSSIIDHGTADAGIHVIRLWR